MSEPEKKPLGKIWYWRPGGIPIAGNTKKKMPPDVTAYAHEGDKEWTPIEPQSQNEKTSS